jgi:hypothetical protein
MEEPERCEVLSFEAMIVYKVRKSCLKVDKRNYDGELIENSLEDQIIMMIMTGNKIHQGNIFSDIQTNRNG